MLRQWVLIPLVMFAATIGMILPTNLLATFESPSFVTYMGAPENDIRIDLQFSADAATVKSHLVADLQADHRVSHVDQYGRVLLTADSPEGERTFRADVGDYSRTTQHFVA
ncbi:MAG: hypothetical protein GX483_02810 [Actinomycetaceae bacterium]|nr:hypothetical protein [Actinomycetaceae bacterium]